MKNKWKNDRALRSKGKEKNSAEGPKGCGSREGSHWARKIENRCNQVIKELRKDERKGREPVNSMALTCGTYAESRTQPKKKKGKFLAFVYVPGV